MTNRRPHAALRSLLLAALLAVGACSESSTTTTPPQSVSPSGPPAPTTTVPPTTTSGPTTTAAVDTTTTTIVDTTTATTLPPVATDSFSIPVGGDGVTYDEGPHPSGPSSFVVRADGGVVITDTMAVRDAVPRLLRFDASGNAEEPIPMQDHRAVSMIDIASDGLRLAVLDIYVALEEYRVLVLDASGSLDSEVPVPEGFHLENGLTGLLWDDQGLLLEIEGGTRYARLEPGLAPEPTTTLVFGGLPVTLTDAGQTTTVQIGEDAFEVMRSTQFGDVGLIGLAPDGTVLLHLDEVFDDPAGLRVERRVQRYSKEGELLREISVDLTEQYVQIDHQLEMTAGGAVAYLVTLPDRVEVRILDV